MTYPCFSPVRLVKDCFSAVDEDSCCHLVLGKSQDCDKLASAIQIRYGHNFPEKFPIGGVEGLSQVNEGHIKIPLSCRATKIMSVFLEMY